VFDIGIWSSTTFPNQIPMVEYHLTKVEPLKLMFLWGNEKCEHNQICHSLNAGREFVLKNMKKVWDEVNPTFRSLGPHIMLLIDHCSFKCIGNMPFSNTLPFLFNSEVENNNLISNL